MNTERSYGWVDHAPVRVAKLYYRYLDAVAQVELARYRLLQPLGAGRRYEHLHRVKARLQRKLVERYGTINVDFMHPAWAEPVHGQKITNFTEFAKRNPVIVAVERTYM